MNGDTRNRTVKCVRLTYATVCARKNSYSYGHNINRSVHNRTWAIQSTFRYNQRIDTFTAAFKMRQGGGALAPTPKPLSQMSKTAQRPQQRCAARQQVGDGQVVDGASLPVAGSRWPSRRWGWPQTTGSCAVSSPLTLAGRHSCAGWRLWPAGYAQGGLQESLWTRGGHVQEH